MLKIRKFRLDIHLLDVQMLVLYLILFFLLLWIYTNSIVVIYGYEGYIDNFTVENIPIALFIISFSLLFIRKSGAPSNFFLHLGLTFVVIPSLVLYCGSNLSLEFVLMTVSAFTLISLTAYNLRMRPLWLANVSTKKLLELLLAFSILIIGSIFAFGGGRFLNFDFSLVYEFRRDAASNLPSIYGYINSTLGKVIIPFAITLAILWRRWIMISILFICAILLFALTTHKSPLFYPFLILFIYWAAQSNKVSIFFLIAMLAVLAIGSIDLWLFTQNREGGWVGSILVRRAVFVPSLLNWFYFDWFSMHDKYYWAGSKLMLGLVDAPDSLRFVNLIGAEYFNSKDMSANTGWIGSGYAQAGLWGVYFYSILIGLFISFLDAYARKLGARIVISLFTLPVLTILTSTDLTTAVFTHGLFIAILLLLIIQPINNSNRVNSPL